MATQCGEDLIIDKYFGVQTIGKFLDLGAYDGKTFSNVHHLIKRGWSGVCVEASPQCFLKLQETHQRNPKVHLVNAAISNSVGLSKFWDTPDAISTLDTAHMKKWEDQANYKEFYIATLTPIELLKRFPGPYDFVSVDIEGLSVSVTAMLLKQTKFKLACVEGVGHERSVLDSLFRESGMVNVGMTPDNVLYGVKT